MGRITFQQGVALAMGAFISPSLGNKSFTLVCEGNDTGNNVTNFYGQSVFGRDPSNGRVSNRLRALFHSISLNENQTSQLDFAALPMAGIGTSGNMSDQAFLLYKSTTTGQPIGTSIYTGGDVDGSGALGNVERALHITGLAILNKLKK